MHLPSDQPRPSVYHDYRVYPAWVPPGPQAPAAAVAIVGAGPVGLTLALLLARHGARSVVLESERQVSEGSRAIVFTRRSLQILQQAGVAEVVVARGLPWTVGHSHFAGQRVFRLQAPDLDDERFGPLTNLQQQVLEEALVEAAERHPLIELRWGQKVLGLQGDAQAPVLRVDTAQGEYLQPAAWVVATDGARSTLRQALGLRMEGDAYEGRFVIADLRIDLPLPTERLAFFDPDWNPGNTVLMHREPQGIWRIDFQLPPGETPEQALAPQALRARIQAQLDMVGHGDKPWRLDWSSVYSARAMTLPDYRCGRVLLAGDAAHLLPIFGVRGANTGLQDAQNLGWKLALVARGVASESLLDSYSQERVQAAREIIAEAGRSTRFMTPPSHGHRTVRDGILELSLTQPGVGPLFHWRTSRAHDHLDSALNASDRGGQAGLDDDTAWPRSEAAGSAGLDGAVLPAVRLAEGQWLLDVLDGGFTWLHVAAGGSVPEALRASAAQTRREGVPCRVIALRGQGGQGADDGHQVNGADLVLFDALGHGLQRLGAHGATSTWLVRPDQHVAGRWVGAPSADQAQRAMDRARAALDRTVLPEVPAPVHTAGASARSVATPPPMSNAVDSTPLERAVDAVADALDAAPPALRDRLLAKALLLLAHRAQQGPLPDDAVPQALRDAQADLGRARAAPVPSPAPSSASSSAPPCPSS